MYQELKISKLYKSKIVSNDEEDKEYTIKILKILEHTAIVEIVGGRNELGVVKLNDIKELDDY